MSYFPSCSRLKKQGTRGRQVKKFKGNRTHKGQRAYIYIYMASEKLSRNVAISRRKRLRFPAFNLVCQSPASPIWDWLVQNQHALDFLTWRIFFMEKKEKVVWSSFFLISSFAGFFHFCLCRKNKTKSLAYLLSLLDKANNSCSVRRNNFFCNSMRVCLNRQAPSNMQPFLLVQFENKNCTYHIK